MRSSRFGFRFVRRVGRRGVVLLFVGFLGLYFALSLLAGPTDTQAQAVGRIIPLALWGAAWLLCSGLCFVQAFMHRDKLAFSFAASLTTAWSGLYFLAWVLGIVPRGWSGGVIYGLLALMIVTISTWPEPVTYNPHDASPNTIVTVTPDGIVTSWQGAGPSMFGWLAAEIVGQPSSVLMPERFRAAHETGLARVRATGVSELARIPLVLTAMHRDGSEFPVRMFLTVATGRDGLAITAVIGRP